MVPTNEGAGVSDREFTVTEHGAIILPNGWNVPGVTTVFDNGYLRQVRIDKDTDLYRTMLEVGFEPDEGSDTLFTFR